MLKLKYLYITSRYQTSLSVPYCVTYLRYAEANVLTKCQFDLMLSVPLLNYLTNACLIFTSCPLHDCCQFGSICCLNCWCRPLIWRRKVLDYSCGSTLRYINLYHENIDVNMQVFIECIIYIITHSKNLHTIFFVFHSELQ